MQDAELSPTRTRHRLPKRLVAPAKQQGISQMKTKHIRLFVLAFPLMWILAEVSATAHARFGSVARVSHQAIPEPAFILILGVVFLVAASGFRALYGRKKGS